MDKKTLVDFIPFELSKDVLTEAVSSNGPLILKGVLQRANAKNQNGRIYPREILEREAAKYTEEFIKQRRALGELDHSDSSVINLKNVSHNIIELHWEGDNLVGSLELLTTPCGNIARELFRNNINVGISSRGVGSVKKQMAEQADVVQSDFELLSFDLVSSPSTVGAFLHPENQLQESVNKQIMNSNNKWSSVENIITQIFNEVN